MDPIDSRLIQAFVLLNRQHDLLERLMTSQGGIIHEIEFSLKEKTQTYDQALDLHNYVFTLIDYLVRFQKIALSLPRFNYRSPEYLSFLAAMGDLKEIRNQIQHINNDLENTFTGPLLGAICWGRGGNQFLVSMNDVGRKRSSNLIPFDTHGGGFPEHFHFLYNGKNYDLSTACAAMSELWGWIKQRVNLQVDGRRFDPKDYMAILSLQILPAKEETGGAFS